MSEVSGPAQGRFRQIPIPPSQLADGVYGPTNTIVPWGIIATLRPRAQDIASSSALEFQQSFDEVDYLQVAVLELAPSLNVALVEHRGAPVPATEVHANITDPRLAAGILHALLRALSLGDDAVTWRRFQA
jgi:hypothetical protein